MATQAVTHDEESFIILSTSPTTSLETKCNGYVVNDGPVKKSDVDSILKDLSLEAGQAFKASFHLGDCPSPASMMAASTMISSDRTIEDLQKKFGELLDENVLLKDMMKKNNESMKEQYQLIATCQEDMVKTHRLHKEKFDETRVLVEKLRQENKTLKQQMTTVLERSQIQCPSNNQGTSVAETMVTSQCQPKSGPTSKIEFVTSPDDELLNKLTCQLDLVEKQRRQVITDNEKLTWQKESLEQIVESISEERDDLQKKLAAVELEKSSRLNEYTVEINKLKSTIKELERKIEISSNAATDEEVRKRDIAIQQYETKVSTLQNEFKNAQLKIMELENVKLEYSKSKADQAECVKMYREQLQELYNRIKEAQTVMFQPARFSISEECSSNSEYAALINNVKMYDRTLKHVAELLNAITNGTVECLQSASNTVSSLLGVSLDRTAAADARTDLERLRRTIDERHKTSLGLVGQIKGTLSIFEGIFKEYQEALKKAVTPKQTIPISNDEMKKKDIAIQQYETKVTTLQNELKNAQLRIAELEKQKQGTSNEDTTSQLARAEVMRQESQREINGLKLVISTLQAELEEKEVMKSQIEVYRCDFEAERSAREQLAADKDHTLCDLRAAQRTIHELTNQLEEVRKLNPNIHKAATSKVSKPKMRSPSVSTSAGTSTTLATGNMVYTCPKCCSFSSDQYKVMEDHFDFCLDDF